MNKANNEIVKEILYLTLTSMTSTDKEYTFGTMSKNVPF